MLCEKSDNFYYIVNDFADRASQIMNSLTITSFMT